MASDQVLLHPWTDPLAHFMCVYNAGLAWSIAASKLTIARLLQKRGLIPVRGHKRDRLRRMFLEICPVLGSMDDLLHLRFFLEQNGLPTLATRSMRNEWLDESETPEGPSRAMMVSLLQFGHDCSVARVCSSGGQAMLQMVYSIAPIPGT